MLRRFFQLLVILLPLGAFAFALQPVQRLMFGGEATKGILLLLAALAVLAVLEGLLFRYWILPDWSDKMAEHLYAGSYSREDDALASLAERIETGKNPELVPELVRLVHAQSWRFRGWLELARVQQDVLADARAALQTLEEGSRAVKDPEDRALLMYRAAQLCEKNLQDSAAAHAWLQKVAELHPNTVYGRRATARLG